MGRPMRPLWWVEGRRLSSTATSTNNRQCEICARAGRLGGARDGQPHQQGSRATFRADLVGGERGRGGSGREADGSITVVSGSFQGKQLNIPNDVIVKVDGGSISPILNASPTRGPSGPGRLSESATSEPDLAGETTSCFRMACVSPDESVMYIKEFPARGSSAR